MESLPVLDFFVLAIQVLVGNETRNKGYRATADLFYLFSLSSTVYILIMIQMVLIPVRDSKTVIGMPFAMPFPTSF
jgi:hypothetical protein